MMTTRNLLVELLVEELPPKALKKLGEAFAGQLFEQLKSRGLTTADSVLTAFASPRRLAAHITEVPECASDTTIVEKLMSLVVAIKDGQPTEVLRKKLIQRGRGHLADLWPNAIDGSDSLQIQSDGKADAVFLHGLAKGGTLLVGLEFALHEALKKLPIPKVMGYQLADGWTTVSFVRPAHGLVALHGSTVVPVKALGLTAGNSTQGHRFEALVSPVLLPDADSYASTLARDGAVIASFAERKAEIARQLEAAAAKLGGGVTPIDDDTLLDEVTALVERPNVLVCSFETEFLDVPQECLILTMKANQKYFPLLDTKGKLTNKFLVVSNISPLDASAVIGGNERVVRPRLADAKFFFDQDRKKTLASRVAGLDKVVYHNKLGTQGERSERVAAIGASIVQQLRDAIIPYTVLAKDEMDVLSVKVIEAARLAKTDLLTDMVGEFPELQGIMGGYYARHDGLRDGVALAIEDHYKPRFAGDALPRNQAGTVVALADKLETLVGMFGIGNVPTGEKDPFALRRHALGVIRMLIEKNLALDLSALVAGAATVFGDTISDPSVALTDFIFERLAGSLREQGYSAQEVDAVLSLRPQNLGDVPKRLAAVRAFAGLPEAPALAAANKRIANILKKAQDVDPHVSQLLLKEPAEIALYAAMKELAPQADAQFDSGDYTAALQTLAALRDPVDAFFDGVMVNTDQMDLRLNRQGLLKCLHDLMNRVADLSKLAS
jgi:glycyl-tRNA synthetase beta chain